MDMIWHDNILINRYGRKPLFQGLHLLFRNFSVLR